MYKLEDIRKIRSRIQRKYIIENNKCKCKTKSDSNSTIYIKQFVRNELLTNKIVFVFNNLRENGYPAIACIFHNIIFENHIRKPDIYHYFGKLSLTSRARIRRMTKIFERMLINIETEERIRRLFDELECGKKVTARSLVQSYLNKKDYMWFQYTLNILFENDFLTCDSTRKYRIKER